jgi:S1-C subfamily serine protease
VIAPGNPSGQTQDGFIIKDLIHTGAAVNPGNSGSPLLNSMGELIGFNTLIFSPSGGSIGTGFAVPTDSVKRIVPEPLEHSKVVRGWLDNAALPPNGEAVPAPGALRAAGNISLVNVKRIDDIIVWAP